MSQEERDFSQEAVQEAEPWEQWETNLVKWSLIIGVAALVVLGALINIFLLM